MTRVYFREYYDRYVFEASGHAGSAPRGEDLVCAAVSALTLTLLETLKDEESDKRLCLRRAVLADGRCELEIEPFSFSRKRTTAILDTVLTGFALLAEQYPDFVKIE